jgi:CheY-like chemotaxis protein
LRRDISYAGSLLTSDKVICKHLNRLETQKKALDSGMNDLVEKPMKGDNLKLLVESNRRETN